MKDRKMLTNTSMSMPMKMQKKRLPQTVKSVLVVKAYIVRATVIPRVIPPATITD